MNQNNMESTRTVWGLVLFYKNCYCVMKNNPIVSRSICFSINAPILRGWKKGGLQSHPTNISIIRDHRSISQFEHYYELTEKIYHRNSTVQYMLDEVVNGKSLSIQNKNNEI